VNVSAPEMHLREEGDEKGGDIMDEEEDPFDIEDTDLSDAADDDAVVFKHHIDDDPTPGIFACVCLIRPAYVSYGSPCRGL